MLSNSSERELSPDFTSFFTSSSILPNKGLEVLTSLSHEKAVLNRLAAVSCVFFGCSFLFSAFSS